MNFDAFERSPALTWPFKIVILGLLNIGIHRLKWWSRIPWHKYHYWQVWHWIVYTDHDIHGKDASLPIQGNDALTEQKDKLLQSDSFWIYPWRTKMNWSTVCDPSPLSTPVSLDASMAQWLCDIIALRQKLLVGKIGLYILTKDKLFDDLSNISQVHRIG